MLLAALGCFSLTGSADTELTADAELTADTELASDTELTDDIELASEADLTASIYLNGRTIDFSEDGSTDLPLLSVENGITLQAEKDDDVTINVNG